MTIEEILGSMQAVIDGADGRSLTDEEVAKYEALESDLTKARKDAEVRARQNAYTLPAPGVAATYMVNPSTKDPYDDLNKAFENYLRTGKPNADMAELRVPAGPTNAQQVGTDSEGGYTVSPQFRQKLVEVRKAYGGLASEVDSFTTSTGGTIEYPSLNDTANEGSITAEEAQFANGNDLVFGTVNLGAFKYTATGGDGAGTGLRVSVELLQDAEFDIQSLVARALGTRIQRKQATDWVTGTGTTMPFGLLDSALVQDEELDVNDVIDYDDLSDTEARLDPEYEQNAKWLMSKATWVAIRDLTDSAGRPLVLPQAQAGIGGRAEKMLMGYPVVIDQACPAHTTQNANFAALGDLREAYVIRRVSPFALVVDPYTRAGNGQVQYFGWERADGNRQNRSAYVILGNQNVA